MKAFSAIFFTCLYILAMFRPVLPLIDYVVNQDYIAEFLCINTDKPELSCNGKCYLMQKITEQNEKKKQNLPKIDIEEYPIGFVRIVKIFKLKDAHVLSSLTPIYKNNYNFLYYNFNFHPPNTQV